MAKNKLLWVKLWCDTFEGDTFQNWLSRGDSESCCLFLMLLTKAKTMGDGTGKLVIPTKRIQNIMRWNLRKTSRKLAQFFDETANEVSGKFDPKYCEFFFHNWLKFQETRGGKREAKTSQSFDIERRKKKEERNPVIPFSENPNRPAPIERQEFQFNPDFKKWKEQLDALFNNKPHEFNKRIADVAFAFNKDLEAFQEFGNRLLAKELSDEQKRESYIAVALKKRIELLVQA